MSLYHRFKDRFGTAGVVVGVIALIVALGGSAFAASGGLTGKQKKEVKAIAKSFQGTGPEGKAGAAGTNGKDGAVGPPGAPGPAGKSVVASTETKGANCKEGGTNFEVEGSGVKHYACNGSSGTIGGTLSAGSTETGVWSFSSTQAASPENSQNALISFPIPLQAPIDPEGHSDSAHAIFLAPGAEDPHCTGTLESPAAESGYLCVYTEALVNAAPLIFGFGNEAVGPLFSLDGTFAGAGTTGTSLVVLVPAAGATHGQGTWAVTG